MARRKRYVPTGIRVREVDNPKEYQRQYYLKVTKPKAQKRKRKSR